VGNTTNPIDFVGPGNDRTLLQFKGASADPVPSPFTVADPGTANNVLTSDGANNWVSQAPVVGLNSYVTHGGVIVPATNTVTLLSSAAAVTIPTGHHALIYAVLNVHNPDVVTDDIVFGIGVNSTSSFSVSQVFTVPPDTGPSSTGAGSATLIWKDATTGSVTASCMAQSDTQVFTAGCTIFVQDVL
jgi:hypothetical protein